MDMQDYAQWKEGEIERSAHWKRVDNLLLSIIKKMLAHSPSRRYSISQIKNHLWFKKKFIDSGTYFNTICCRYLFPENTQKNQKPRAPVNKVNKCKQTRTCSLNICGSLGTFRRCIIIIIIGFWCYFFHPTFLMFFLSMFLIIYFLYIT
jgi:serine/threonine protein kinase